jgi:hypothetical protein
LPPPRNEIVREEDAIPYEEHDVFAAPDREDTPLWRYMSLAKLLSLVSTRSLFFSRSDLLDDPWEGAVTPETIKQMRDSLSEHIRPEQLDTLLSTISDFRREHRKVVHVTSWHMSEHESEAMWRLYLPGNEGVAVQSTYARLRDSLASATRSVHLGTVHYLDYETAAIPTGNAYWPTLCKRRSFEHERELRGVTMVSDNLHQPESTLPPGVAVEVDLNTLVERVYVPPKSQPWFHEAVQATLTAFSFDVPVRRSDLDSSAIF